MSNKSLPLVTIVTATFNNAEVISDCLESVLSSCYPNFEVILVDNGSSDDTLTIAKEYALDRRLKIIVNEKNFGQAQALNTGAKLSNGKYIVFLDSDTKVERDWLNQLVGVMETDLAIGCAQANVLLIGHEKETKVLRLINYVGQTFTERISTNFCSNPEIFFPAPMAMIVRKSVFERIRRFDPKFFGFRFEVDFGWRIWLSGYKCVLATKSKVLHIGGNSLKKLPSSLGCFHNEKNKIAMMIKNYELVNLVKFLPIQLAYQTLGLFRHIYRRESRLAVARLKAFVWVIKTLRHLWVERLAVQYRVRKVSDTYVMNRIMRKPILRMSVGVRYGNWGCDDISI